MLLVWRPAGQVVRLGETHPWAGEGPARLIPVQGPDPGNSVPLFHDLFLLPSRPSPLPPPFLLSIFPSSLFRPGSRSPLPPVSPHPLPFWCWQFSAARGGSESSPSSASSRKAVQGSRGLGARGWKAALRLGLPSRPARLGRTVRLRPAERAERAPDGRRGGSRSAPGAGLSRGPSKPQ